MQRGNSQVPEQPVGKRMRDYTARTIKKLRKAGVNVRTATREEVRRMVELADKVGAELMRVFHGSGAKFDAFDHSHMGEGEGSQVYGWGTYVSQVYGIAKNYANIASRRNPATFRGVDRWHLSQLDLAEGQEGELRTILARMEDSSFRSIRNEMLSYIERDIQTIERNRASFIEKAEEYASPPGGAELAENFRNRVIEADRDLAFVKKRREFLESLDENDFSQVRAPRYLYDVEIPDDNGTNYLSYTERMTHQATQLAKVDRGLTAAGWQRQEGGDMVRFTKDGERITLRPVQQGRDLYAELAVALGSDRAASEFLRKCGIVGIKYPAQYRSGGRSDGAMNFVIFNEADAKITNVTEFLRTSDGTIYGWHDNDGIHLTEDGFNPDTPVHEYTHGFMRMLKEREPEKYRRVVEGLKDSEVWQEVLNDEAYADIKGDEDAVASEVASRLTGRENARRANTEFDRDNYFSKANAVAVKERVKNALQDLWNTVRSWFGEFVDKPIPYNRIAGMTLRELDKGTNVDAVVNGDGGVEMMGFTQSNQDFDSVRDRAVNNIGIVLPNLGNKEVRIVYVPNGHPFDTTLDPLSLKKQVKEYAKNHPYEIIGDVEVEGGIVNVSLSSIGEMADKKSIETSERNGVSKDIHLSALMRVKSILENSVDCEIHPDYNKGKDGKRSPKNGYSPTTMMHVLYGVIDIDGTPYSVRSLVKETKGVGKNKAYMYSLEEIELNASKGTVQSETHQKQSNSIPLAKVIQDVEKSYESGKNLLEESKKTTEKGIPEFSIVQGNKGKTTESGDEVLYRDGDTRPTFYSNAERAVENVKQNKASAEQWYPKFVMPGRYEFYFYLISSGKETNL